MIYIMSFGLGTMWSNSSINYKKSRNVFSRNKKTSIEYYSTK